MTENIKFLKYLSDKLKISSDELANFLFIDRRTVYNYKNYSIEKLPKKVKEKLLIFFNGYSEFYEENLTIHKIHNTLESIEDDFLKDLRLKFLSIATIREKNKVIYDTTQLIQKTTSKRSVESLDEFLIDFRTLVEYSHLTKGYLYTIFEIIISKVGDTNDYALLDHINKYVRKNSNE